MSGRPLTLQRNVFLYRSISCVDVTSEESWEMLFPHVSIRPERVPGWKLIAVTAVLVSFAFVPLVAADDGDEPSGAWFPATDFQLDSRSAEPTVLHDGRILVSLRPPTIWNPLNGVVQYGSDHHEADLEFGTGWRLENRTALGDGRILVAGGVYAAGVSPGSTGSTDRASIYDQAQNSWVDVAQMPERRSSHTLTLLEDGSILAAGGEQAGGVRLGTATDSIPQARRYIPDEDRWIDAGQLNQARINQSAVRLEGGNVLIIGGRISASELATTAELYDPVANDWSVLAEGLPTDLEIAEVVSIPGDRILILGGVDSQAGGTLVYELELDSGEFVQLANMNEARENFSATVLNDGSVLVTGGNVPGQGVESRVQTSERYLPEVDEWQPVLGMRQARSQHQLVSLGEDAQGASALVYGGTIDGWFLGRPELFYLDPPGVADRQPPPSLELPSNRYFPLTGHYLSHGFKDFWEQSGGLPVFGYPLTTEFDEFNSDLGELRTSQYVERQRFEFHPEHAGTPYEVLLGRLGFISAEERNLLDTEAFEPVDPALVEDDCFYFDPTGQAACGEFLDYWSSHGLNFGDDGISFRESLALFGYPISQEFHDPDTGLITQYFERARFELHPDNPAEYRVLLGRLGADIVDERDWE
jgi:hypothetical protein